MPQTWNNVIEYIKINLGGPLNMLEINDEDLVKLLKNQVLPFFSQYSPAQKYTYITDADMEVIEKAGAPMYIYKIPLAVDEKIIDIIDVYNSKQTALVDAFGGAIVTARTAEDLVMSNSYIDAIRSLSVRNTWEFFPPNRIGLDVDITGCTIVYNTVHETLDTIQPDMYELMFKKLCLANVKVWIANMRSKFNNLATPFGQMDLNWDRLLQEGQTEKQEVMVDLNSIPPDHFFEIS
jgi:hypothetical protein